MMRVFGALAVLLICAQSAFAGFGITAGANAVVVAGPAGNDGTVAGQTTGTSVYGWLEGISTATKLAVDDNGTNGPFDPNGPVTLPNPVTTTVSGPIRSYMLDFNPTIQGVNDPVTVKGAVFTFANKILGLIFNPATLNASDSLSTVTYDPTDTDRGFELYSDVSDRFHISGNTLTIDAATVTSGVHLDQMRVITAVPEPATLCTWGLLGLGLAVAVRRKWLAK